MARNQRSSGAALTVLFLVVAHLAASQLGLFPGGALIESGLVWVGHQEAIPDDECFYVDPRFDGTGFDCVVPENEEEWSLARCSGQGCSQLSPGAGEEALQDSTAVPAFGREISCMTGMDVSDSAGVVGQDSAVIVPFGSDVVFFFGDTVRLVGSMIPNSMAWTSDPDASDGIELSHYYGGFDPMPALPRIEGEVTVWISDAFVIGDDIFSYYVSMPPDFREVGALGHGTAVMPDGQPPFQRTDFFVSDENDPFFLLGPGHATLSEGFAYQFSRREGVSHVHLKRIPLDLLHDTSSYEYWTGTEWSNNSEELAPVFPNAAPPTVRWSEYHGEYLALYSVLFSPSGLLSEVGYRTSPSLTGPWSEEVRVRAEPSTGGFGSSYQAHWDPVFSRDEGRVIYFTSTKSGIYNVFLNEIQFDYAETTFSVGEQSDSAYERIRKDPTRLARTRTKSKHMRLRREGKSVVALRLTGTPFYPATDVETAVLSLPLRRPLRRDGDLLLLAEVGVPNEVGFTQGARGELRSRTRLSSKLIPVSMTAGDEHLVIDGPELQDLVETAIAHPDWRAGFANALLLYLTRTDSDRARVVLAAPSDGDGGSLNICVGQCG